MKKHLLILAAALLLAGAAQGATITIINVDGPGEGFNDTTPATPVGGNPGTTIGDQRLNLFQQAADIWGGLLVSTVEIRVESSFDPLDCDASGAVLGAAGANVINRDFIGAEFPGTWYHGALADKRSGVNFDPGSFEIRAFFNVDIDNNNACLSGTNWYYGFDGNAGGDIALLPVLLHEMAHGLGFSTFTNEATGSEFLGFPDIYERFILDTTTGLHWNEMTERPACRIGGQRRQSRVGRPRRDRSLRLVPRRAADHDGQLAGHPAGDHRAGLGELRRPAW